MNNALIQAATQFKKDKADLIAQAKKGDTKEYNHHISLEINRVIGLFDDFDAVRIEFEKIVRQKG